MDLALFDFDGTITTSETFRDFLELASSSRRKRLGRVLLAPLVIGYRLGFVSGNRIRAQAIKFGFARLREAHVIEQGRLFAERLASDRLRTEAMERITWHKARGDRVVVVSGALDTYLKHWCRSHDLELICSQLEVKDGRLTGRYLGEQCVGEEKPRRVREIYDLNAYPTVYAYGDTPEDFDLLRIASQRYYRWKEWRDTKPSP
jgi:phosphatidylglycerophosphatase C